VRLRDLLESGKKRDLISEANVDSEKGLTRIQLTGRGRGLYSAFMEAKRRNSQEDVLIRYDGKRVKEQGPDKVNQYFIKGQLAHYLGLDAAIVCEEANIPVIEINSREMALLMAARGSDMNAEQMRAALHSGDGENSG
jgi:hypothetical protein